MFLLDTNMIKISDSFQYYFVFCIDTILMCYKCVIMKFINIQTRCSKYWH